MDCLVSFFSEMNPRPKRERQRLGWSCDASSRPSGPISRQRKQRQKHQRTGGGLGDRNLANVGAVSPDVKPRSQFNNVIDEVVFDRNSFRHATSAGETRLRVNAADAK